MRFVLFAIVALAIYFYLNEPKNDTRSLDSELPLQTQESINTGKINIESVRSAIRREYRRNSFRGDAAYPEKLSSDNQRLFDQVLITPILASSSIGWKKSGISSYQYTFGKGPAEQVVFDYDQQTGEITCISNFSECALFKE